MRKGMTIPAIIVASVSVAVVICGVWIFTEADLQIPKEFECEYCHTDK